MNARAGVYGLLARVAGVDPAPHTAAQRWLSASGSEAGLMAVARWTRRDMLDRYTRATAAERARGAARRCPATAREVCDLGDMSSGALGAYRSKIGHEVAGSHNKRGRATESYTIVGLLREVIDTYEVQAFRAWQELERTIASKRRKVLTGSDGAQQIRARPGTAAETSPTKSWPRRTT
jgi:hypothetical protein